MEIHETIEALRGDSAPQHAAQEALAAAAGNWRDIPAKQVLQDLVEYGAGEPLAQCHALAMLFDPGVKGPDTKGDDAAAMLVDPLIGEVTSILRQHPLGHVPFRHQLSDGIGVMMLGQSGRANLSLILHQPGNETSLPETVCFADNERMERVLCGSGNARILRRDIPAAKAVPPISSDVPLGRGTTLRLSGTGETKYVSCVRTPLVTLRLIRSASDACPSEEVRLSDGAVVHRSSAYQDESRDSMAIALIGAMGRRDAAPQLAHIAADKQASNTHRWDALRHCLALDTAHGFSALSKLAADAGDPLAATATALRVQLIEAHPALSTIEAGPIEAGPIEAGPEKEAEPCLQ